MTEPRETICVLIERTGDAWHVSEWAERTGNVRVPDLPSDRNPVRVWMWAREHARRHGFEISNAPWTDGKPGYPTRRFRSQPDQAAGLRRDAF